MITRALRRPQQPSSAGTVDWSSFFGKVTFSRTSFHQECHPQATTPQVIPLLALVLEEPLHGARTIQNLFDPQRSTFPLSQLLVEFRVWACASLTGTGRSAAS